MRQFFSGSSLEQAIMRAARHYGLDPDELAYTPVRKRHGFLRTRRSVVIEVDPGSPRRPEQERTAPSVEEAAPATAPERPLPTEPEEDDEPRPTAPEEPPAARPAGAADDSLADPSLLDSAREGAEKLLRLAGLEAEATAAPGRDRLEIEVTGPDSSVLLAEKGKGLLAIQHLMPRLIRGLTGKSRFVRVDSAGFHRERKERLRALALREAAEACRRRGPRTLAPMAPDERRIVHLALNDNPDVVTESHGSGLFKRIVIRPAEGPGDGDER